MESTKPRLPAGVIFLCCFCLFGVLMCSLTCLLLLFPGGALEPIWRLNPPAREQFLSMGGWAVGLMLLVGTGCAVTAYGLWIRARWGYMFALGGLVVNLIGDLANAFIRGDFRTLIGLPLGDAMIAYLLSARVKSVYVSSQSEK